MSGIRFLAVAWALLAALVAPTLIWAADDPAGTAPPAAEQAPVAPAPVASADPAAPALPEPAPAPQSPAEPVPAAPQPAATPEAAAQTTSAPATPPPPAAVAKPAKAKAKTKAPVATAAGAASVTIKDFEFGPDAITVNVGDTVTWKNQGPTQHTATAKDGSFDTGLLAKGASGSHTFETAGTYSYICTPHPFMTGTVTVAAVTPDSGGTSGSGSGSSGDGVVTDTSSSDPFSSGSTSTTDTSSSLPTTGFDSGLLALAGLLMLAGGVFLRRHLPRR